MNSLAEEIDVMVEKMRFAVSQGFASKIWNHRVEIMWEVDYQMAPQISDLRYLLRADPFLI